MKPASYKIQVSKDGFDAPPAQVVEVKAGEETGVSFVLKAVVRMATLRLRASPGAQVYIDGLLAGTVAQDGTFSSQVAPGEHSVELRRNSAKSRTLTHQLQPGQTFDVPEDQLVLQQPNGTLRLVMTPAEASLTIRRSGEPESGARPMSNPASLAPGDYVVTASAPGYASSVITLQVTPGSTTEMPVILRQLAAQKSQRAGGAQELGIADFDDPSAWYSDNGWMVRCGGKYVTFKPRNTAGVFTFEARLRKGKRLQWFLGYTDPRNYALFRVERNQMTRLSVVNGKTRELGKFPLPGAGEFRITVAPDRIVHEVRTGGQWTAVDQWTNPEKDYTEGKFGFILDEGVFGQKDEYAIRNFSFRPSR